MHLLLGNSRMESRDYKGAIQSFKRARAEMRDHTSQVLLLISLVSFLVTISEYIKTDFHPRQITSWKFDNLYITISRQLCEALRAVGHAKEAAEVVLEAVKTLGEEVYMSEGTAQWVAGRFTRRLPTCCAFKMSLQILRDNCSTLQESTVTDLQGRPLRIYQQFSVQPLTHLLHHHS